MRSERVGAIVVLAALLGWSGPGAAEPQTAAGAAYDAKGRRDPFEPLVVKGRVVRSGGGSGSSQDGSSKPTLEGIVWDPGGQSIALVSGTEAKVGDIVNGYEILEIQRDAVVVTNGGQPVVLQIAFESARPEPTMGGKPQ